MGSTESGIVPLPLRCPGCSRPGVRSGLEEVFMARYGQRHKGILFSAVGNIMCIRPIALFYVLDTTLAIYDILYV